MYSQNNINIYNKLFVGKEEEYCNNKNCKCLKRIELPEANHIYNNDYKVLEDSSETQDVEVRLFNSIYLETVLRENKHEIERSNLVFNRVTIITSISTAILGYFISKLNLRAVLYNINTETIEGVTALVYFGIFLLMMYFNIRLFFYLFKSIPILNHRRLDLSKLSDLREEMSTYDELVEELIFAYEISYDSRRKNNNNKYEYLESAQKYLQYSIMSFIISIFIEKIILYLY